MKAKYYFLLVAFFLAALFVSCSDSWPYSEDAYDKVSINAYPSYITLGEDVFEGEFYVNSSDCWRIYESPSWIKISTIYGYGYDNVSFKVDENAGDSNRHGYIKIRTDEGFTKETEVEVSQPPTMQFEASMSTTHYSASGDWWYLAVKAASSRNWTVSKSDSWVHLGYSYNSSYTYNGRGEESIKIYVDANSSYYSRSSTLTVKCGSKTQSITITQDGKSSKAPFSITRVEVGNVDYNWNYINNYGTTIYSYQTQYLTPRIYVSVYTPGTYVVYVKLYNANGILVTGNSSPYGYSYSEDITLYSSTTYKNLMGWGGSTSGHYSAGQYRFEIYYNGDKIAEKSFRIY